MKPTIEIIHKITIKGQTFELTTEELSDLYDAIGASLGNRKKDHAFEDAIRRLEELKRRHNEEIGRPKPVLPQDWPIAPKWEDWQKPFLIHPPKPSCMEQSNETNPSV